MDENHTQSYDDVLRTSKVYSQQSLGNNDDKKVGPSGE